MTESYGINKATSTGVNVTSGAANTKGSWTTCGTATADFKGVDFFLRDTDIATRHLIDLRIGGATVIATDIATYVDHGSQFIPIHVWIPFSGVSGNTIECRWESQSGSRIINVCGSFLTDTPWTPANVTSNRLIGVVDPGGTANTQSGYYEVSPGTDGLTHPVDYLFFTFAGPDSGIPAPYIRTNFKLFTGSPGSEVFTGVEWLIWKTTLIDHGVEKAYGFFVDRAVFKTGARVWVTAQSNDIVASDRESYLSVNFYQLNPFRGSPVRRIG